eukprot:748532-Prorocentrum_minimum.AAC.2
MTKTDLGVVSTLGPTLRVVVPVPTTVRARVRPRGCYPRRPHGCYTRRPRGCYTRRLYTRRLYTRRPRGWYTRTPGGCTPGGPAGGTPGGCTPGSPAGGTPGGCTPGGPAGHRSGSPTGWAQGLPPPSGAPLLGIARVRRRNNVTTGPNPSLTPY